MDCKYTTTVQFIYVCFVILCHDQICIVDVEYTTGSLIVRFSEISDLGSAVTPSRQLVAATTASVDTKSANARNRDSASSVVVAIIRC